MFADLNHFCCSGASMLMCPTFQTQCTCKWRHQSESYCSTPCCASPVHLLSCSLDLFLFETGLVISHIAFDGMVQMVCCISSCPKCVESAAICLSVCIHSVISASSTCLCVPAVQVQHRTKRSMASAQWCNHKGFITESQEKLISKALQQALRI